MIFMWRNPKSIRVIIRVPEGYKKNYGTGDELVWIAPRNYLKENPSYFVYVGDEELYKILNKFLLNKWAPPTTQFGKRNLCIGDIPLFGLAHIQKMMIFSLFA